MSDDVQLREMTCDPKFRKVLVSDTKTAVGQAVVRALVAAGADIVWAGHAEPWKRLPGFDALVALPQVTPVPLDLTDSRSVTELAGEIGGKVDIVVNTAEYHRAAGIGHRVGIETARSEMDVNYFGLLRLAQAFGPALRARAADGPTGACAWVNLLSIFALANFPAHGTFSASKAAALSLAQCLRAEMRPAGVRVVNVFPGPIDDEWTQLLPPSLTGALLPTRIPRWAVKFALQHSRGERGMSDEDEVDEYWAPTQFPAFLNAMRLLLHSFTWSPWTPTELAGVRQPLLLLFGDKDPVVRPQPVVPTLARSLRTATLEVAQGAGHVVPEERPEWALGHLLPFLGAPSHG